MEMQIENLPVIVEYSDTSMGSGIGITAVTKLKHADLYAAAKQLGSQSALGRHLGLTATEIGEWVNLKKVPPPGPIDYESACLGKGKWTEGYFATIEGKLLALTGKTWDELFPPILRDNIEHLSCRGAIERTAILEQRALEHYASQSSERLFANAGNTTEQGERICDTIDWMNRNLKRLTLREREVIKLRYGLRDGYSYTLIEVAKVLKISREGVRKIEARAIRKMQTMAARDGVSLMPARKTLDTNPRTWEDCAVW